MPALGAGRPEAAALWSARRVKKAGIDRCAEEHPNAPGRRCDRPKEHRGQHRVRTPAGHAYWGGPRERG